MVQWNREKDGIARPETGITGVCAMENNMMRTTLMTDIRRIEFSTRPIPAPKAGEVLVKVDYVGICGSDLHYYETGRIGDFIVEPPFVLGHEASGTVVALGEGVTEPAVGTRVTMEPNVTCGECEFCRSGKYNLCPDVVFFATPPVDGVFLEYVTHPAKLCFPLPETVSSMQGALVEPLAVGFHAANQAQAGAGQTAVIFGAGCIGLVTVMALQSKGVKTIYVADIVDSRLAIAEKLGAIPINVTREDSLARIRGDFPLGLDMAFDTSGVELSIHNGLKILKKGGTMVLIGYSGKDTVAIPTDFMINSELTIRTIFRYRHVYPEIIEAIASGKIQPEKIVTDTFSFEEIPEAMEQSLLNKARIVKAVICCE